MKKVVLLLALLTVFSVSFSKNTKLPTTVKGDKKFQQLSNEFISGYLAWRPEFSTNLGFHEFDGKASDLSITSISRELSRLREYDQILNEFDTSSLSSDMYYDFKILHWGIKKEIFRLDEIQPFSKNPMTYVEMLDVSMYLLRNFAPIEERLKSIINIENSAPALFEAARANLDDSIAKPFIETAIQIANGSIEFLESDLIKALEGVKNDSLMAIFKTANDNAIAQLNSFIEYLEKEKLPKAHNNYSLGIDKYAKMLRYGENISLLPDEILEIGLTEMAEEQEAFSAAAKIINPNKKPIDVYKDLQKEHPDAENLITDVANKLEHIQEFVINKDLVTVPSEANVKVEETPTFARSTSSASISLAGPYEKKATEAYYFITPVDPKWTAKQKEDWLSMFDNYTIDIISIHEIYPGHYTHYSRLNQSAASKIEKIFISYAMSEGWAHYSEKMMLDEGFGKSPDPVRTAKYRLAQSGEALLRLCRLCVSIKTHCQGMLLDDATKFFMDNWYQGEEPSRQEAIRGTWDPEYLYYSLGKLMILKLREDFKRQEGDKFSLKHFHDLIMEKGIPPVPMLREHLLIDKNTWGKIL